MLIRTPKNAPNVTGARLMGRRERIVHHHEIASALFQIGIVLASATIITGMIVLAWGSGVLVLVGIVIAALGLFSPHLLHLH